MRVSQQSFEFPRICFNYFNSTFAKLYLRMVLFSPTIVASNFGATYRNELFLDKNILDWGNVKHYRVVRKMGEG